MKALGIRNLTALCLGVALAACGESDPLPEELTAAEWAELEVLSDEGSFSIAVELSEATSEAAASLSDPRAGDGRMLNQMARARFAEARSAALAGEHRRAIEAAREARRLVARALRATAGGSALEGLIERIEALALTADEDLFEDVGALRSELEAIAAQARALLAAGDSVEAGARALLGEQRARYRRWRADRPEIDVGRVRLAVALAGTAVRLAERLISASDDPCATHVDAGCDPNQWLGRAKRLLALAELARDEGHPRKAVHFAEHAQWSALQAVLLPGGVQQADIEAIADLARDLFAQAEEAIGEDASDLEKRLLGRAASLIEIGLQRLEAGERRGVAALWRAAVVCAWLLD